MNINNNPSSPSYIPLGDTGSNTHAVGAGTGTSGVTEINAQLLQTQFEHINRALQTKSNTQNLPPPPKIDKQSISSTVASLGQFGSEQVGADIYSFMALFQKLAQTMRDTARTDRNTMLQTQVKALQDSANEMRSAAALRFAAGVVQGAMQLAGGVAQVGFSASAMTNTIKGANIDAAGKKMLALDSTNKAGIELVQRGAGYTATGLAHQGYGQASGSIGSGLGGIVGAGLTYGADMHDAKRTELEAKGKIAETGYQDANDIMQQMLEVIRDVRDKLSSMEQAAVETNRGIARNI